jgi:cytochrome c oxidase subunit 3
MARGGSKSEIERAPELGGGGPTTHLPGGGFGGDDGHGEDERRQNYRDRLRRCRLGLGLSMVSVTVLFIALTSAFLFRQHHALSLSGDTSNNWMHVVLPPILFLNTVLLLLSSGSLEMARRRLRERELLAPLRGILGDTPEALPSLPWLGLTLVLGFGFLFGQMIAWRTLRVEGFYLERNPSSAFFYLLTGTHALHLTVGLIALIYAALARYFARTLELRCLIVDVTSWYWHFMAILWIYIYALLAFGQ